RGCSMPPPPLGPFPGLGQQRVSATAGFRPMQSFVRGFPRPLIGIGITVAKGYSTELRQQVIAFLDEGNTVRQAAAKFGVSPSFAAKARKKQAEQAEAMLPLEVVAAEEASAPT